MSTILFADCCVSYDGRAQSELDHGKYLIIIKPDGSTLIHGSDLSVPRNYMGPGTSITRSDNTIICRKARETIRININNIIYEQNLQDWSAHKIKLVRTEAELRDKLISNLAHYIPGYTFASIVPEGRTEVGPCDILATDDYQNRHIIEIKRHRINISSVVQVRKYVEALSQFSVCKGYVAAPTIIRGALNYCRSHDIVYIKVEHDNS